MDLESPTDAWILFLGVSVISFVLLGLAISTPTTPSPDADAAANGIESTALSSADAATSYSHNADEFRITPREISLRNDGGESHATVVFDEITPVYHERSLIDADHQETNDKLLDVLFGSPVSDVFDDDAAFLEATKEAREHSLDTSTEWRPTIGELRVRKLTVNDEIVILVTF